MDTCHTFFKIRSVDFYDVDSKPSDKMWSLGDSDVRTPCNNCTTLAQDFDSGGHRDYVRRESRWEIFEDST